MIENRVSTLLGSKRASIRDLARDAGIAYGTAFALYRGNTTRIELDVLDKLCNYFGCTPCEVLAYKPERATTLAAE
jgi:putative transcriptional regulator